MPNTFSSISLSGKSEAKGRNGLYKIGRIDLWNLRPGPHAASGVERTIDIDISSTREGGNAGAKLHLTHADAVSMIQFLHDNVVRAYPEAVFEGQLMECSACGKTSEPHLEEGGYEATHSIERVGPKVIMATGWNGDSDMMSEEGDGQYFLICDSCGASHSLPAGMEVEWMGHLEHCECGAEVTRDDPYFSSPCGTFCETHMEEHAKGCGICADAFDLQEEPCPSN